MPRIGDLEEYGVGFFRAFNGKRRDDWLVTSGQLRWDMIDKKILDFVTLKWITGFFIDDKFYIS